jgi:hypothetical protein
VIYRVCPEEAAVDGVRILPDLPLVDVARRSSLLRGDEQPAEPFPPGNARPS